MEVNQRLATLTEPKMRLVNNYLAHYLPSRADQSYRDKLIAAYVQTAVMKQVFLGELLLLLL